MPQVIGKLVHDFEAENEGQAAWFRLGARALQAVRLLRAPAAVLLIARAFRQGRASVPTSTFSIPATTITLTPASGQKALSALSKDELGQELRSCGADVRGATVAQMRETLRHLRGQDVPKNTVKGISSMKKADLEQVATERGIEKTGKTVTQLRLAIQGWDAASAAATGQIAAPSVRIMSTDVVGFGQHKGSSYRSILVNRPFYARWVVSTKKNQQASTSPALQRLAIYLEANGVTPQMKVDADHDWRSSSRWITRGPR